MKPWWKFWSMDSGFWGGFAFGVSMMLIGTAVALAAALPTMLQH